MTPEQAIVLLQDNDLKAVCEAFGRADTQWHEKEWKEFVELVREEEREKVANKLRGHIFSRIDFAQYHGKYNKPDTEMREKYAKEETEKILQTLTNKDV